MLQIYKLPYNANRPVICVDEMPKQLLADQQESLPCQAGTLAQEAYEYKHNGVAGLSMACWPLAGKRFAEVTEKHGKIEFKPKMLVHNSNTSTLNFQV